MPRPEQLVRVADVRAGDEVRWSMRDKPHEVKTKEDAGGTRVKITLANGAWRTYDVEDRIIRLDPKPETKSDHQRRWGK